MPEPPTADLIERARLTAGHHASVGLTDQGVDLEKTADLLTALADRLEALADENARLRASLEVEADARAARMVAMEALAALEPVRELLAAMEPGQWVQLLHTVPGEWWAHLVGPYPKESQTWSGRHDTPLAALTALAEAVREERA